MRVSRTGRVQEPLWIDGIAGLFQLLSRQESRRVWRGRRNRNERSGIGGKVTIAAHGVRKHATSTSARFQLSNGWRAGRRPWSQVEIPRSVDRSAQKSGGRVRAGFPGHRPSRRLNDPRRDVYHQCVVRVPERDAWRTTLTEAGVQTGVHYPIPVHLSPACADLGVLARRFPRRGAEPLPRCCRCRCFPS